MMSDLPMPGEPAESYAQVRPVDSKPRCPCGYRATSLNDLIKHMSTEIERLRAVVESAGMLSDIDVSEPRPQW